MNRCRMSKATRAMAAPAIAAIIGVFAAAAVIPAAWADMWKCTDKDGNVRYTNVKIEAKGCQVVVLDPLNTVSRPTNSKGNTGPATFPSVSNAEQKARDGDRRKILDTELANEERLLGEARRKLKEQEELRLGSEKNFARVEERMAPFQKQVQLHDSNIANIRKEITGLR